MSSKINVKELKEMRKQIDNVVEVQVNGLKIEVKKYLPIKEKMNLVNSIYQTSLENQEMNLIDYNKKEIAKVILITQYYTNIKLPKDILEGYDFLMSTGIYSAIEHAITHEIITIKQMVRHVELYNENKHKKENDIKAMINKIIDKTPTDEEIKKMIEQTKEEINNFEPNKLKFVKDFINKTKGGTNNGDKNVK